MPLVVGHRKPVAKARDREGEPAFKRAARRLFARLRADPRVGAAIRARKSPAEIAVIVAPKRGDLMDDKHWRAFADELQAAFVASVEDAGGEAIRVAGLGKKMRFRVHKGIEVPPNPHSIQWIREHGGELIVGISNQQRSLIRGVVERAYKKGGRPESIASQIRAQIGLTDLQAGAVERRRESMIESGVEEEQADKVSEGYGDKLLDQRADTIARTENKAAQCQGQQDAWLVAQEEDLLPPGTKKQWMSMPESPRLSDICEELNGQTVALNEPFYSEILEEEVRAPPAHPNCRSTMVLVFDDAD